MDTTAEYLIFEIARDCNFSADSLVRHWLATTEFATEESCDLLYYLKQLKETIREAIEEMEAMRAAY